MLWCSVIARWTIPILVLIVCPGLGAPVARAATQADTLLHRQAPGRTFGISSDTAYIDDSGHPTSALLADRFLLSQSAAVCSVRWWGFYGGTGVLDPGPPSSESFRIRFFDDIAGLPGSSLYEAVLDNPARSWTGSLIGIQAARKEYFYQGTLPQCLVPAPGSTNWIEIAQLDDINSRFRWENSNTLDGFAVQFPIGTPWRLSSNPSQLAYELWTPEPCSGVLFAGSIAGAVLRMERRKR
jgi:hypothetical protein